MGVVIMGANREYKSTLFSELFSEPQTLRELYNALADTNYGEDTIIEINTLESAFFNDIRNDVSFTIDNKYVVLLEHQSTINANMPLRFLMYIARVYEKITTERAIYHEKLINLPTPEFMVLYNGLKAFPAEKTLNLSDAYIGTEKSIEKFGSLDLTVKVVNINPGYNDALLNKSKTLNGYTAFIEHIRHNQSKGIILRDAISEAINWGMTQEVMGKFLTEHGTEVGYMIPGTTFNIDIAKEVWQEEAYEDGFNDASEKHKNELDLLRAETKKLVAEKDAEAKKLVAEIERLQAKLSEHNN